MSAIEEWRPIDRFPGYEVSSEGRVRSWFIGKDRRVLAEPKLITHWMMTQRNSARLILRRPDGELRMQYLRPLVLEAFVGPPKRGMLKRTRHREGKYATGNRLEDLSWASDRPTREMRRAQSKINNRRKRAVLRYWRRTRERAPKTFTERRHAILEAIRSGMSREDLMARFKITSCSVTDRVRRAIVRYKKDKGVGDQREWLDESYEHLIRTQYKYPPEIMKRAIEAIRRGEEYGDIVRRFGLRSRSALGGLASRARKAYRERRGDPELWLATPPRAQTKSRVWAMAHARKERRVVPVEEVAVRRGRDIDFDLDPDFFASEDGGHLDGGQALSFRRGMDL